ncbi:replication-relaxation family protein [Heyndrickxia shackletonii]|uniref:replication-relaxation family protein n=1 Tax=Heyndrickxia shackletonii TaxID=157838 RepID=UPI0006EBF09A|nr:replication-relaxation family protein [Heyndrickxia shackletonii]NEY99218.1 hypothetical protein [Heyndrickxia shackletonii]
MRQRDLDILNSLEKFKCLERDQIAALHFSKNANPIVNCNRVLKRLRTQSYILANTNRSFQQYLYFLNPSSLKLDSQKIDHYLMIAQGYIDLNNLSPVSVYDIEPKIKYAEFIPDVKMEWLGNKTYFLEYQNSLYSCHQMHQKLGKYKRYFEQGYGTDERVLIIGKINLKFNIEDYPFKVMQVKTISELEKYIKELKKMNEVTAKSVDGTISWKLEV